MNEREQPRITDELGPYVDETETDRIQHLAEWLEYERPAPSEAFRAELAQRLAGRERETPPAPAAAPLSGTRPGLAAAAYAGAGLVLLAVAALGLAGAGPLAA